MLHEGVGIWVDTALEMTIHERSWADDDDDRRRGESICWRRRLSPIRLSSWRHTSLVIPWQRWSTRQLSTQQWSWCYGRPTHGHQYTRARWPGWHVSMATRRQLDVWRYRHDRFWSSLLLGRCSWWHRLRFSMDSISREKKNKKQKKTIRLQTTSFGRAFGDIFLPRQWASE